MKEVSCLKLWTATVILALLAVALTGTARGQRAIPDDNLAYPVLVQLQGSEASGFYLNTTTAVYFVTAKHVLFSPSTNLLLGPQAILLSYPRDPKGAGKNVVSLDLVALSKAGEVSPHPKEDVVVVRIAKITEGTPPEGVKGRVIAALPGVAFQQSTASGLLGVSLDSVKKYDDVLVANDVIVFGYPTSLGLQQIPQLDRLRPLLRRGIVAGLNPATKSLIIDCPAYPGNSGGPVLEIDHTTFNSTFKLIGVVREFVPFAEKSVNLPFGYENTNLSNSGYTVVTPMDSVLELVK